MGRHEKRASLALYRREASHTLTTFLVEPNDPALNDVPLLQHAARRWLDLISVRVKYCIICSSWIANRQSVGALLLSMPVVVRPTSASVCSVCRECWDADLGLEALERAATTSLRAAVPGGRFLDARR